MLVLSWFYQCYQRNRPDLGDVDEVHRGLEQRTELARPFFVGLLESLSNRKYNFRIRHIADCSVSRQAQ